MNKKMSTILKSVTKPGRYAGGEFGQIIKDKEKVKVVVIGIDTVGNDVINHMLQKDIASVKFVHINTGEKEFVSSKAAVWSAIDKTGRTEDKTACEDIIKDADMVFVTCNIDTENKIQVFSDVAQFCKHSENLTVGMLMIPCEVQQSIVNIMNENDDFKTCADTMFVVPLQDISESIEAFVFECVKGIVDSINEPALIGLDFADVRIIMKNKGFGCIGIGRAKGDDKGIEAVKEALVKFPLLKKSLSVAKYTMANIYGDMDLLEVNDAMVYLDEMTGTDNNIIFSAKYEEELIDEIVVVCITTGYKTLVFD